MLQVFVVVCFTFELPGSNKVTRPGLEPGITESKSVVLPITLSGCLERILDALFTGGKTS